MSAWTHTGRVVGANSTVPAGYTRLIELRETKTLWLGRDGTRWRKADGYIPASRYPAYQLDLKSIVVKT